MTHHTIPQLSRQGNRLRPLDRVLQVLPEATRHGERWAAKCPVHAGVHRDSLSVREAEDGRVLLYCFAGCDTAAVLQALGLEWLDLFPVTSHPAGRRVRIAAIGPEPPTIEPRWVVADAFDAERLTAYGFRALAIEDRTQLTLTDLGPWLILLQCPGEERTLAGLDVRAELRRLGWAGTLTSLVLPFPDLDVAEQECGERFSCWLLAILPEGQWQTFEGHPHTTQKSDSPRPGGGVRYVWGARYALGGASDGR